MTNTEQQKTSSEIGLTVAAVWISSREFALYSRMLEHPDSEYRESYSHGQFGDLDKALYSLGCRHDDANVRFSRPYVRHLLQDHTFVATGVTL